MNRCLIILTSVVLTFVTIGSVCSATTAEWRRAALGSTAGERSAEVRSNGHWGAGWLSVTPSKLVSIDEISL